MCLIGVIAVTLFVRSVVHHVKQNPAMAMAAKTWHGEWWKLGGGGTVWESLSYDPKLNLVYFGVGNGVEWVATDDNLDPQGISLECKWPTDAKWTPIRDKQFRASDSYAWKMPPGNRCTQCAAAPGCTYGLSGVPSEKPSKVSTDTSSPIAPRPSSDRASTSAGSNRWL